MLQNGNFDDLRWSKVATFDIKSDQKWPIPTFQSSFEVLRLVCEVKKVVFFCSGRSFATSRNFAAQRNCKKKGFFLMFSENAVFRFFLKFAKNVFLSQ